MPTQCSLPDITHPPGRGFGTMQVAQDGQELRRHARHDMMRRVRLQVGPTSFIDCILRNISKNGAMVALPEDMDLPARFILDLSGNIAVKRTCELVWQEGRLAGLRFSNNLSRYESSHFLV